MFLHWVTQFLLDNSYTIKINHKFNKLLRTLKWTLKYSEKNDIKDIFFSPKLRLKIFISMFNLSGSVMLQAYLCGEIQTWT